MPLHFFSLDFLGERNIDILSLIETWHDDARFRFFRPSLRLLKTLSYPWRPHLLVRQTSPVRSHITRNKKDQNLTQFQKQTKTPSVQRVITSPFVFGYAMLIALYKYASVHTYIHFISWKMSFGKLWFAVRMPVTENNFLCAQASTKVTAKRWLTIRNYCSHCS